MPDGLKTRVKKALEKLDVPHEDISDQADPERIVAAFYVQPMDEDGKPVDMAVLLPKGWNGVWVQSAMAVPDPIGDQPEEWLDQIIAELDAGLQYAPAGLFSQHRMPRFRERGFLAHVTWSYDEKRIIAAVAIPSKEFASASLAGALTLAVDLGGRAAIQMIASFHDGPQTS